MAVENKGIVFVIDGAGGSGFLPFVMGSILSRAGFEMNHFKWSAGYMRIIKDLTNREINRKRASELAAAITDYRKNHPDKQIHLVAKSAGTALALWCMSELADRTVDRVVLLSPAVSPGFPISTALHAARQDVYSFWSPNDVLFLGYGTSLFGTADGVAGKSAGLVGFASDTGLKTVSVEVTTDSIPTAKLCEIKWNPSMISSWHTGDHSGTSMPPFIRKYVIPLLTPGI